MDSNLGEAVKRAKQNQTRNLFSEQIHSDDRRLAASFVEMAGALPCRPAPRAQWDNVAALRAAYKGKDAVLAAQNAIRAAITTGDMQRIEDTAHRVAWHFDGMKDVALKAYHAITGGTISIAAARVKASKETHEALHHIMSSTVAQNDGCELTVREIDEAIQALSNLRSRMVAAAGPVNRRPALSLS